MPRLLACLLVACGVLTFNNADAADAWLIRTSELQLRSTLHALPQVPKAYVDACVSANATAQRTQMFQLWLMTRVHV
jgi:hypothetical protein